MTDRPIQVTWDGEVLRPTSTFWLNRAREAWGDGEILMVEAREERSSASHNHLFAAIAECWQNLPDEKKEQYPTPEHLRKWATIKAGFHDRRDMPCAGPASAMELARFIRPIDTYAVVLARGDVVSVYTAKSLSLRSMDKAAFAKAKEAILDVLGKLIGTTANDLSKAGEQAA